MADNQIRIPDDLGLTQEQISRLRESFQNQLVDSIKGTQAEAAARAKTKREKVEVVVDVETA